MTRYIGLLHKEKKSHFGVSFPDFPGCVTAGKTLDDAYEMAQEALAFHIEGMIEDGEQIPKPSALDVVLDDPASVGGVVIVVDVQSQAPKAVRINITMPDDILAEIDDYVADHGLTRSGFLARAAKRELGT